MLFGFSTGALHQYLDTKGALQVIKKLGCPAVELGFVKKSRIEQGWLESITKNDLSGFKYVSFHAPKMYYEDNDETREIFHLIEQINNLRSLDLVLFHPDNVVDIEVFKKVSFPVGFENMDRQKPFGKTPEDIKKLLDSNPTFHFVLDVNHIKSNDPTMKLADDFYSQLNSKIIQYHVSGLGSDYPHIPLFQTKELDIISAIRDTGKPIICESRLSPDTIKKEKEYITKNLRA